MKKADWFTFCSATVFAKVIIVRKKKKAKHQTKPNKQIPQSEPQNTVVNFKALKIFTACLQYKPLEIGFTEEMLPEPLGHIIHLFLAWN